MNTTQHYAAPAKGQNTAHNPVLQTAFVKIGQSGPTVDGRDIKPEWLLEAAASYQQETYTALIWPEHDRWGNNYGKVLGVEARKEDAVVSLFAKLAPNASYVCAQQYGQKLFFSMELQPNFAGTGKAYLVGLAVTDSPASLATQETRFFTAQQGTSPTYFLSSNCPALPPEPNMDDAGTEAAARSFMQALGHVFTKYFTAGDAPAKEADVEKKDDAIVALTTAVTAMQTSMGALVLSAQALEAKVEKLTEGTTDAAQPGTTQEGTTQANHAVSPMAGLEVQLAAITNSIADLTQRLSATMPGTQVSTTTGPAGSGEDILL
ncbi:GPO family capsid scaffolding protein [Desulfovibrio cuneatus]|uniref:GPO family capsid scaffolding protein n=1 Tax=Desulfovibrio cuneatus TaxID=159728 RepID=UPI0003F7DA88|nr:GPO family capsid scaffolding protein [Desulfovibrio cuneatus]